MADKDLQSEGRRRNAALPPGRRDGLIAEKTTLAIGRSARTRPGPDDVHPDVIGDAAKRRPPARP
ncbi:MAG: hypothetical protein ACOY4K_09965 [Pseudomonadota bacterium]